MATRPMYPQGGQRKSKEANTGYSLPRYDDNTIPQAKRNNAPNNAQPMYNGQAGNAGRANKTVGPRASGGMDT